MAKTGVLLVNIGSPDRPETKEVAAYLEKFLMDKKIIDLPFLVRWPLVNLLIVPKRAPISAGNYKKVWLRDVDQAPLTYYTKELTGALSKELGNEFVVRYGMAYASPNVEQSFVELETLGCERILVVPLFPQYAEATTGSIVDEINKIQKRHITKAKVQFLPPFFRDLGFLSSSAKVAAKTFEGKAIDHYLFSFHGLPEKQVLQNTTCHLNSTCCNSEAALQKNCYRAQCFKTAELIADLLKLPQKAWSVSFQSRLGRAEWLRPYTSLVLENFAKQGIKNIAVLSPSFVSDCLETLEELGITAKESFLEHGGKELTLAPCVNLDVEWIRSLAQLVRQ
jgi:ferrochelatase